MVTDSDLEPLQRQHDGAERILDVVGGFLRHLAPGLRLDRWVMAESRAESNERVPVNQVSSSP